MDPDLERLQVTRTAAATGGDDAAAEPRDATRDERAAAPLQLRDPGRYTILGEHGRGGLGRVCRARDRELGRDVAIKELLRRGYTTEARFFREALITARLEHPGIVPVHEAGRWPDGTPFYAMKLVAGRSLEEVLADAASVTDRLALLPRVVAVAEAIAYAHDRRIIHRDLKPSNVIVGEFGETIVIDWGLAKDLSDEVPDAPDDGPFRTAADDGLTVAGSVLGTPAYMAPEQRGGRADERADVYALGGLLHHLLTGRPPHPAGRADARDAAPYPPDAPRDLVAIASRALAAAPSARYPSAAAFADDLKRFSRREPVAARRYSAAARAALGFARHRAIALAIVAGLLATSATLGIALVKLTAQRGRERAARIEAEGARLRAQAAASDLILANAELLLERDPTAAAAGLRRYEGADLAARHLLRAQARGRGVALADQRPHADQVLVVGPLPGARALSIALDRRVAISAAEGVRAVDERPRAVAAAARDPRSGRVAYAAGADVLVREADGREVATLRAPGAVRALALSPGATSVAALADGGAIDVWRLASAAHAGARRAGADVVELGLLDDDTIVAAGARSIRALGVASPADAAREIDGRSSPLAIAGDLVAVGGQDGAVRLYRGAALDAVARLLACDGPVRAVLPLPGGARIAYGCADGRMGVADVDGGAGRTVASATHRAVTVLAVSDDARHLAGGGEAAEVVVHDLVRGTTARLRGHDAPISALAAPAAGLPYLVSGDVNGAVRVWATPAPPFHVVRREDGPVYRAVFAPDGGPGGGDVVIGTAAGALVFAPRAGGPDRLLQAHRSPIAAMGYSADGARLATLTIDGAARVFDGRTHAPLVEIRHDGDVADVKFLRDGTPVSAGADGTLRAWAADGRHRVLHAGAAPLRTLDVMADDAIFVTEGLDRVVRVERDGRASLALAAPAPVTVAQDVSDGRTVVVGAADGSVHALDVDGRARKLAALGGVIRDLDVSPDRRWLAAASEDGWVHIQRFDGGGTRALELPARARSVRFAPDAPIVAIVSSDGSVLFHDLESGRSAYLPAHDADVIAGRFSPDGAAYVSCDTSGVVVLFDMVKVREELDR